MSKSDKAQFNKICQIYPKTIPPIKFGKKKTVLKKLEPLIPPVRVRASAIANAKTFIRIVETTVNAVVKPKACQNSKSVNAYI